MSDARDTLRALAVVDRCVAVWCAAQCARTVLHLVAKGEERPQRAIEAAERFAKRRRSTGRKRGATVVYAICLVDADAGAHAANAAYAVSSAANIGGKCCEWLDFACRQIIEAMACGGATRMDAAADILVTITAQRWPLIFPSNEAIRTTSSTLAVAWDRLACVEGNIGVAELLRAHRWATEQGLDWSDPVARAVVERVAVTGDTAALDATAAS